jgi:hypothetical protein
MGLRNHLPQRGQIQMQKKDGLAKQTKASLEEAMKCGECLHFKHSKHVRHEDLCATMGIKQFALAPDCFTPCYPKVITNTDEFVQFAALVAEKTPQQRKIMMAILRQKPMGKKIPMGTKMYLNYRGPEYISNYLCGYVVGYTSANQVVLTGSPDANARGRAFFAYLKSDDSLLSPKEWKAKFTELRRRGRIQDPNGKLVRDITAKAKDDNYEVPTIDNAPDPNGKKRTGKKEDQEDRLRRTSLTKILTF